MPINTAARHFEVRDGRIDRGGWMIGSEDMSARALYGTHLTCPAGPPAQSAFQPTVEAAVLNGLGHVGGLDSLRRGEIGQCSGDFQHTMDGAG